MKKIFAMIAILVLLPSFVWGAVTVVNTKDIDGTKQWVYISLTVDGDVCRYVTVQPWNSSAPVLSGVALDAWVNSREVRYSVEILKGMYPGARFQNSVGGSVFERFTQWITDGNTNAAYCSVSQYDIEQDCIDNGGVWVLAEVITKVLFQNSWQLAKVDAEKDMKTSIFYDKTNQQIQDYLTSNVTNLTEVQQYLYKLTINQRNMERRMGWSPQ